MGRPLKFKTIKELQNQILEYFEECKGKKLPTKGGLSLYLNTSRKVLGEYEKKEGYSNALKEAYMQIEDCWVQKLGGNTQVAGAIFYLKNAFRKDWQDRHETDLNIKLPKPILPLKNVLPNNSDKENNELDEKN